MSKQNLQLAWMENILESIANGNVAETVEQLETEMIHISIRVAFIKKILKKIKKDTKDLSPESVSSLDNMPTPSDQAHQN